MKFDDVEAHFRSTCQLGQVFNPAKKREDKVFQIDVLTSVDSEKELRKVIFDKVGKNAVHFDLNFEVGYYEGIKEELCQVLKKAGICGAMVTRMKRRRRRMMQLLLPSKRRQ